MLKTYTRKVKVQCGEGEGETGLRALDGFEYAHRFDDDTFRVLPDRVTALDVADADLLTRLHAVLLRPPRGRTSRRRTATPSISIRSSSRSRQS